MFILLTDWFFVISKKLVEASAGCFRHDGKKWKEKLRILFFRIRGSLFGLAEGREISISDHWRWLPTQKRRIWFMSLLYFCFCCCFCFHKKISFPQGEKFVWSWFNIHFSQIIVGFRFEGKKLKLFISFFSLSISFLFHSVLLSKRQKLLFLFSPLHCKQEGKGQKGRENSFSLSLFSKLLVFGISISPLSKGRKVGGGRTNGH